MPDDRGAPSMPRFLPTGTSVRTAFVLLMGVTLGIAAGPQVLHPPAAGRAPTTVAAAERWVGTWGAAPAAGVTASGYAGYTIRNVVHTSVAGSTARVRLSNRFGTRPVLLAHATIALPAARGSAAAAAGTVHDLLYGSSRTITMPAGAEVYSDPVSLAVPADADLMVTTFTPAPSGPVTYHPQAVQTSFFGTGGDHAGDTAATAFAERTPAWHYVVGVEVLNGAVRGTLIALGDSITDGVGSTRDASRRWPNFLARRLLALPEQDQLGVVDEGIGGNRVLLDGGGFGVNAVARLDRDVLGHPAARTLIVLEGINDIQETPHQLDAAQIVAGLRQIAMQARAHGLRVLAGTLTPFGGWSTFDAAEEATRRAVNEFVRTDPVFDAYVDFDAALRDPADPLRLQPQFDSGDHLHPNDAGYQAMAAAVDLTLL